MSKVSEPNGRPRPAVVAPDDGVWETLADDAGRVSVRIDFDRVGAPNLIQRRITLHPGGELIERHSTSEDVLYVIEGEGEAAYAGLQVALRPGVGLLVPAGEEYRLRAHTTVEFLSVIAPPPGKPDALPPAPDANEEARPWIHQSEEEVIPAGDDEERDLMDRYFKLMIDPRHGAHFVTQFLGFIERSKAPAHTHTYDEVIYIVGGEGIVHIEGGSYPVASGYSVYLPPGSVHCLENRGDTPLALLGVFCPAGSPKSRQEA